jgi:glycosyltransferase involved in cell wall biosynthesis
MVLCEAWSQETPVVVQNACEVLRGQTVRSGGGLRYANFAEFEQCLLWLTEDADLAPRLGASGRQYVEQHYTWDVVMASYEHALEQTIRVFAERHPVPFPMPMFSR